MVILERKKKVREKEREREANKRNSGVNNIERRVRVFTGIKESYRVI